jgi:glycosyltransferase involved in cell wall biosynthesis
VKVLHVVYSFMPDAPGGTELYVDALCRALQRRGVANVVTAPAAADGAYEWTGIPVRRFAIDRTPPTVTRVYGADTRAARQFAQILAAEQPDVVHQHALTAACSHEILREAHRAGVPVAFTYHTPTVSCTRGTLLHDGRERCDGHLDVPRCSACTLQGLGVEQTIVTALEWMPDAAGRVIKRLQLEGGVWTAVRMRELIERRHGVTRAVLDEADRLVSLAPWVTELLRANGVPPERIVESAHGITVARATPRRGRAEGPLRVAHLGRLDPVKGTRVLIEAMRAAAEAPIALDVFGLVQHDGDRRRLEQFQSLAGADRRIRFYSPLAPADVVPRLAEYDLLAVPSQWLETGPLVVLEAFAAGTPVLGSNLGGIADKVRHGVDGLLVAPHDDLTAWVAALRWCASDPERVARLRTNVRPPRSMEDVADDMHRLYASLASARERQPHAAQVTAR